MVSLSCLNIFGCEVFLTSTSLINLYYINLYVHASEIKYCEVFRDIEHRFCRIRNWRNFCPKLGSNTGFQESGAPDIIHRRQPVRPLHHSGFARYWGILHYIRLKWAGGYRFSSHLNLPPSFWIQKYVLSHLSHCIQRYQLKCIIMCMVVYIFIYEKCLESIEAAVER